MPSLYHCDKHNVRSAEKPCWIDESCEDMTFVDCWHGGCRGLIYSFNSLASHPRHGAMRVTFDD